MRVAAVCLGYSLLTMMVLAPSLREQSDIIRETWWQKPEVAGHHQEAERDEDVDAELAFSVLFSLGPQPREW